MARMAVETLRRAHLVDAAIHEIGRAGRLDVTVGQIAKRAGVSTALAHHYFGTKERILLSAMRKILSDYAADVRRELALARTPRSRLEAIVRGSLAPGNFRPEVVAAWLTFYVSAQNDPAAERLFEIYKRRLRSNLLRELRILAPDRAETIAEGAAAMIDGLYIRRSLASGRSGSGDPVALVVDYLDRAVGLADQDAGGSK